MLRSKIYGYIKGFFLIFELWRFKFIEISLKIVLIVKIYEVWGIREKNRKIFFFIMKF